MSISTVLSADIETTILVAVWSNPVIFQGYFKIVPSESSKEYFIYFRALCEEYQQEHFIQEEFYPDQLLFTHLYNQMGIAQKETTEDALYLLKYALYTTVTQMLKNKKHYFTYADEVALSSLIKRTALIINEPHETKVHEDLGFAVNMHFQAQEKSSEEALLALLQLAY